MPISSWWRISGSGVLKSPLATSFADWARYWRGFVDRLIMSGLARAISSMPRSIIPRVNRPCRMPGRTTAERGTTIPTDHPVFSIGA